MLRSRHRIFTAMIAIMVGLTIWVPAAGAHHTPDAPPVPSAISTGTQCGVTREVVVAPGSTFKRKVYHSDCPSYSGWGQASSISPTSCMWTGCRMLQIVKEVPAYRLTSRGWDYKPVTHGEWVYTWQFGHGWSWAWNYKDRAWYAMQSTSITIWAP